MAFPVLVPPRNPDIQGAGGSQQPSVNEVKFKDGYSQRIQMGINNMPVNYGLTWRNCTTEEKEALLSFFRWRKGVYPFWYAVPDDIARQYLCRKWEWVAGNFGSWDVMASFTENFDPES